MACHVSWLTHVLFFHDNACMLQLRCLARTHVALHAYVNLLGYTMLRIPIKCIIELQCIAVRVAVT